MVYGTPTASNGRIIANFAPANFAKLHRVLFVTRDQASTSVMQRRRQLVAKLSEGANLCRLGRLPSSVILAVRVAKFLRNFLATALMRRMVHCSECRAPIAPSPLVLPRVKFVHVVRPARNARGEGARRFNLAVDIAYSIPPGSSCPCAPASRYAVSMICAAS